MKRAIILLLMVFSVMPPIVVCQLSEVNTNLLATKAALLKRLKSESYDVIVPPNYPEWTPVGVTIMPLGLQHLNDREETITSDIWVQLTWHDPRLEWETATSTPSANTVTPTPAAVISITPELNSTFADTFTFNSSVVNETVYAAAEARQCLTSPLPMTVDQIWTPYISVYEMTYEIPQPVLKDLDIIVRCDGHVRMTGYFVDSMHCTMRTRYFPFDKQACKMTFYTIRHVALQHRIRFVTEEHMMKIYEENMEHYETGEWKMFLDVETFNRTFNRAEPVIYLTYGESELTYTIVVQRKAYQHVLDWILPPILLSSSSVFAMYLGCDITEKYSFGGTVVVTLTLMLSSFREKMPIALDGYPILASLYVGLLGTNILATLFCAMPNYLHTLSARWRGGSGEEDEKVKQRVLEKLLQANKIGPLITTVSEEVAADTESQQKLQASQADYFACRSATTTTTTKVVSVRKQNIARVLGHFTEGIVDELCCMFLFLGIQATIVAVAFSQWNGAEDDFIKKDEPIVEYAGVVETVHNLF